MLQPFTWNSMCDYRRTFSSEKISGNRKQFKIDEKCFTKILRYLNFCSDFFDIIGKRFDEKAKDNLRLYDVTSWGILILHNAEYLRK